MPIELGEIFARIKVDASQVAAGLASARAQIAKFGAEMGTTFDGATAAVKRQNGSIQQWKVTQDTAAASVKNTTSAVVAQSASVKRLGETYFESMRKVQAMRAAASEMAIAGTAIVGAYAATIKTGGDFNVMLGRIQNNTGITNGQLKELKTTVEGLGLGFGGNMAKIAAGEMHAINLFHDMAAARAITIAGAKAAIATGGDEEQVINGLAKSLKEWNVPARLSGQYMNGLVFAANRANTTLPEMMNHTDRIRATFANLNLPLSKMLALYATLTQHGLSASQAETQLVNVTQKIIQPTKQAADAIEFISKKIDPGLKKAFSLEGLQKDGFTGLFERLTKDAQAMKIPVAELIEKLFPNLRGILAALVFSGTGMADLRKNTELFQDAFGRQTELNSAVDRSQKQLNTSLEKLHNQFIIMAAQIAGDMTPGLVRLMAAVTGLFRSFEKLSPATRSFLEWGGLAAGALLLVGSRVLSLVATFYQLRTAILAAEAAGKGGILVNLLGSKGPENATGLLGKLGPAAMAGGFIASMPDDLKKEIYGPFPFMGPSKADAAANEQWMRAHSQLRARPILGPPIPAAMRPGLAASLRAAQAANGHPAPGNESFADMLKKYKEDQKAGNKAARAAAAEAKRDAKETARDLEREAEETKEATRDAAEKLYDLTHNEYDRERRDVMKEVNQMTANRVPRDLRKAYLDSRFRKIAADQTADKDASSFAANQKRFVAEIKANAVTLFQETDTAVKDALREEATHARENNANMFDTFRGLLWGITPRAGGINKADLSLVNRGGAGDSPQQGSQRVQSDIDRLSNLRATKTTDSFKKVMEVTSKAYAFDYEQTNVSGENYLRFLQYKLDLTERYSDEWMAVQQEMQKVEHDYDRQNEELNRASAERKKKLLNAQGLALKEMLKGIQRDTTNVLANLFDDLLSGHKNPFKAFFDAFKQMLIRMAAELAASELMKLITGLFGKKGGATGGRGGSGEHGGNSLSGSLGALASSFPGIGGAIGAGIGAVGKIFGFAEGGWVPGPIGKPQPAVVHGGEFVVSRQMMAAGAGGGGVSVTITGPVHIRNEADLNRLAERIDYQSRVRRGSGR